MQSALSFTKGPTLFILFTPNSDPKALPHPPQKNTSSLPLRLDSVLNIARHILELLLHFLTLRFSLALGALEAALVQQYPSRLRGASEEEEEVYGGEEDVAGADDEAPTGPDEAGSHEGGVRVEGELRGGAGEV